MEEGENNELESAAFLENKLDYAIDNFRLIDGIDPGS